MKKGNFSVLLAVLGSGLLFAVSGFTYAAPIADVHLHYNWDQAQTISPEEAIQRLEDNNVGLAVISSKPPILAKLFAEAGGEWILPFYMPYLEPERKRDWIHDDRVLPSARKALESGGFKGLGEFHLISGYAPSLRNRQPVIDGMIELGVEFDVPISIHVEAGSYLYFLPLCLRHPHARLYWAHAGGNLPPDQVASLMTACPNVWIDLSARDPRRYGLHPITNARGHLLPAWRELVLKFPHRVMIGSDPFFKEDIISWDAPNIGWDFVGENLAFHLRWLSDLPADVARKIQWENALAFFRVSPGQTRAQVGPGNTN